MNRAWWKEAVVYQIYPRSFMDSNGDGIGDLQGIVSKLDYLKEFGIDVIWICPTYKSPNDDNGYDISDYQDIMDEFGTMGDFDRLLEEVHARGMKLILDLVINHTSDEHPWFIESRSGKDSGKRDYYIWSDPKDGAEPNNWESIFGGPAWELDEASGQYYMHIFSRKQPDLNWENPKVRQELYDMVNWWLDKGIDGFRVDAISHIKKVPGFPDLPNPEGRKLVPSFDGHMNREGIHVFLDELKRETLSRYDVMTVGEANGVSVEDTEDVDLWVGEENGKFNMIFQFEHLKLWNTGEGGRPDLPAFKKTLTRWQKGLEGRGWNALFMENHDLPRSVSIWGDEGAYRVQSAKALATMYFLMHGTPYIYQGQEIGMTNVRFDSIEDYNDVAIRNLYRIESENGKSHEEIMKGIWSHGRDNSRTPMQWNDGPNAGFTEGKPWLKTNPNYRAINVAQDIDDPDSIYHHYRRLIRLRKQLAVAVYGTYDLLLPEHESVYAYTRTLGDDLLLVAVNLSEAAATVNLPKDLRLETSELLLASDAGASPDAATEMMTLKPFESRVYLIER
ncbi:glycoside hydrolase family 13 protein [Cohnella candidum]|uniref:Alpha-amylase n=1 Tax=Cohnella candidum TaxID=2674991 RepID=A0A3G3K2D9_9BACL|nr:alpha-glucosidase [Cohnella candidum]AYQ73939.1 alpha-glucosidase [Cohnella candidum]